MKTFAIAVRPVRVEEIYDLRMSVLIVGTKRTSPQFLGDHESDALHMGAF